MSHSTPRLNAIMNADTPPPSPLNDVNDDVVSGGSNDDIRIVTNDIINETNDMKTTPTPKDESRGGIDVVSGVNPGVVSGDTTTPPHTTHTHTTHTHTTHTHTQHLGYMSIINSQPRIHKPFYIILSRDWIRSGILSIQGFIYTHEQTVTTHRHVRQLYEQHVDSTS